MTGSRQPGDLPGRLLAALRAFGSRAVTAARAFARRAWPVLRRGAQVVGSAIARMASAAFRMLKAAMTRLAADMRPGAETQTGESGSRPTSQHVYAVRRIVIFGLAALVVVALVVGVVCGVRALSSGGDAGANGAATSQTDRAVEKTPEPAEGDTDGDDATGDAQSANPATPTPVQPLTDQQRADILAKAQETAAASGKPQVQYTYCVATQGDVGDASGFETIVYTALNDPRGWPRAGATFTQSTDGACDMTLILAAPDQMTTFSEECSDEYSCRVGDSVVINVDRWNNATDEWLADGGTVDRYRVMVVNHEVGHRLGHFDNETVCGGAGQPAPLMQQQSMGLQGCVPNEWPLDGELWVSQ